MAVQMALISKARPMGDISKRFATFDHIARKVNTPLDQIGMRGQAGRTGEIAQGLKFAQACRRGKIIKAVRCGRGIVKQCLGVPDAVGGNGGA